MPRILLLGVFVALCSVAFVSGNLWAGGESSAAGIKKYKKYEKKPSDSLAKALSSAKKSLHTSHVSSKKGSSTWKSAHRTSTSKKISGTKSGLSQKAAHLKSKSRHKTSYSVHSRSPKKAGPGKSHRSREALLQKSGSSGN